MLLADQQSLLLNKLLLLDLSISIEKITKSDRENGQQHSQK